MIVSELLQSIIKYLFLNKKMTNYETSKQEDATHIQD